MRKIGAHVSIAGGVHNSIRNIQDIGGNCVQIFAGSPRSWARLPFKDTDVNTFTAESKKHEIAPVFIHALYLVNLATDKHDLLIKSRETLISELNSASQIDAEGVIVHIGSHQGRGFESVKDQIVQEIKIILSKTKSNLILENDAGQNGKIGDIEELGYLFNLLNNDRIKICLDTAHLFESGYDFRTKEGADNLVHELSQNSLLDSVVCIHLNDSATPLDSHNDRHQNIGEGEIGLKGLSNFINHPKLIHLPLILEVPGKDRKGPDKENIEITKSLIHT